MYMAELTTALTQAVLLTFDENYPVPEFRNVHASPEFPVSIEQYPAIWVDFEPTGPLETGGISQQLTTDQYTNELVSAYRVWLFRGNATFTVMALSSLERDRLFDEMVKVIAFGDLDPTRSVFRQTIENNPWIATNIDFDQIGQQGKQANGGTPWGSDDMLYEITLSVGCIGEFQSDPSTGQFPLLSRVEFVEHVES